MTTYPEQINSIIEYIYLHLDSDEQGALSTDTLSELSGCSKFHFHRQFQAYTGVTLYRFVQLLRLKRASYQLVYHPQDKIIDIAFDAGFESHEAFSRAFKKRYGLTPLQFRQHPKWETWLDHYNFNIGEDMNLPEVDIVEFSEQKVALLKHRGNPKALNHSISRFIEWRKSCKESPIASSHTFGIAYHDPDMVAAEDFKFDICGSVKKDIDPNPQGVINSLIPGGRCARIIHQGSYDLMGPKIHYLYKDWLSKSGETLRDFPCFFEYQNFFPQVSEAKLCTVIYLPIV